MLKLIHLTIKPSCYIHVAPVNRFEAASWRLYEPRIKHWTHHRVDYFVNPKAWYGMLITKVMTFWSTGVKNVAPGLLWSMNVTKSYKVEHPCCLISQDRFILQQSVLKASVSKIIGKM